MAENPAVLVLTAGRSTRMKSETPKVLHQLMGRPILEHVLNAALYLAPARLALVTGFGAEAVEARTIEFLAAPRPDGFSVPAPIFVRQAEQLGTGHAVAQAREVMSDFQGPVLIMAGDVPLISPNTLEGFLRAHQALGAHLSVLTVSLADPGAYGRIIRDEAGWLARIVEYRDADEDERLIQEINSGLYAAEAGPLFEALENLTADNDQREYYLTDVAADFRRRGLKAAAVEIPETSSFEVLGINDRRELAEAQAILRDRINEAWLRAGVTLMDPPSTLIEASVRLGRDVRLWPGVILTGRTIVGEGAEIGPYSHLDNCRVAPGAKVPGHQAWTGREFG
ncbi:MAG: NTP transferase domain-containing protein [Candidatus Adiutrix sp.]|jgi:bifunctional UDP-N-acetylglucosamine pyrophosphorylase/glucosamine-1-phosphate N-acetyltransferase|nr:NTP transferase domain-containing protein [Candidatus Adiutrix sp.]